MGCVSLDNEFFIVSKIVPILNDKEWIIVIEGDILFWSGGVEKANYIIIINNILSLVIIGCNGLLAGFDSPRLHQQKNQ